MASLRFRKRKSRKENIIDDYDKNASFAYTVLNLVGLPVSVAAIAFGFTLASREPDPISWYGGLFTGFCSATIVLVAAYCGRAVWARRRKGEAR